jgi:hypothetical protein
MTRYLENLDRRVIYLVLSVLIFIPLYRPMGLPLPITRETRATFDFIDSLPSGSIVLMTNGTGPNVEAELVPQTVAMIRHMMAKKLCIVITSLATEAPTYNESILGRWAPEYKYEYGKDYLILPYKAGGETAMAAIGRDIKSLFQTDNRQKPLTGVPLWDRIKDIKSFALAIDITGGEGQRWLAGHIEAPYKVPCISAITRTGLAITMPFFSSGQFKGILAGLNGAAEYEVLAKVPGVAAAGMDAQSLGHLWVVLLVILGNVASVLSKRSGASAGK